MTDDESLFYSWKNVSSKLIERGSLSELLRSNMGGGGEVESIRNDENV